MARTTHSNTCLLVVDMQEGFRYPETEKIIPRIQRLAPQFGKNVYWALFRNPKKSLFETQLRWKKFQRVDERKIMREFARMPGKKFVHKGYSVLKPIFVQMKKFDVIFVCGIYTDVCVAMSAMEGFDAGIKMKIVSDACTSPHGKKIHASAIESLKHVLGKKNVVKMNEIMTIKK